ncbi:MAG: retropepsin-like aspartic protease [Gemmatimonadaceae bacterium]
MKLLAPVQIISASIIAALLGGASACAPKPVEVNTGAIVTLDTSRQSSARIRKPAPARSFWVAMTNLDPDYALTHPVDADEREFAGALKLVMSGSPDEAELVLDSLGRHATDSIVRSASHILLTAALQYQDKWKELAEISRHSSGEKDRTDIDRADVELWAMAFKNVPRTTLTFPTRSVVVPLSVSAAGTPVIPVQINGKQKYFWLDTGSSMSIISSDVAAECGVEPLVSDTLEVATTTGRVAARPAAIRNIDIGGLSISNSTAMIVAAGLMEVRIGDLLAPAATAKIDGIIGFDIIRRLKVEIDYQNASVRLSQPAQSTSAPPRNFFWVGTPIVRVVSSSGVPIHLGLDTGAQETYATERLLDKVRVRTFVGERKRIGGFAGLKEFRGRFIADLRLGLRGKTLLFQKLLVFAPSVTTFITLDGVLGSDVGRTGVVQIDATNGVFSIDAPQVNGAIR